MRSLQQYALSSTVESLLSSLRGQSGVAEVSGPGFIAGIGHHGVVVGTPDPESGTSACVFLQLVREPVVDEKATSIVLEKLSRLQQGEGQTEAKCLLLYPGSMISKARQDIDGSGVIARSLRSLEDLRAQFWATLLPEYEEPGLVGRAQELIQALDDVPEGAKDSVTYEGVCGSILEFLFSPELGPPRAQVFNSRRSNKRDLVMRNEAEDGFWAMVRDRYQADYLVAEFKNGSGKVSNPAVWQLAGYLKEKGVGSFGLLIARHGVAKGTSNGVILDQWIHANKMIVPLSNDDLRTMIRMRDSGSAPTEFIENQIDEIRYSV